MQLNLVQQLLGDDRIVHAAFNYVVQPAAGGNRAAIIGNTQFAREMSFGGTGTHTLVMCDVFIRPHTVITSNHLQGMGAAGILKKGLASLEPWAENGAILIQRQ